jgi:fatty-acyl-CoA synthase
MSEWFEKRTLGQTTKEAAKKWGNREALVFGESRWTWLEFEAGVSAAAKGLISLGVEPGEKVALWMNNKPEWLFLMYAVAKVGGVLVPLNTRYRSDDIKYVLSQSNTGTLLSDDRSGPVNYLEMIKEVIPNPESLKDGNSEFPDLRRIVFVGTEHYGDTSLWTEVLASGEKITAEQLQERESQVAPDDLMLIGYTSGTTGDPKGVMHNHTNIRNCMERASILGITFTDIHINYLPMFHIYALSEIMMICALTGAKQVLMESFDASKALALIEKEKVTLAHGFDTHWKDLLDSQSSIQADVSTLRLGTLPAGTEATIPVAELAQDVFCPTVSGFGMTEIWAFAALSFPTDTREQRIYASGYPMSDISFKVVNPESGITVEPDELGELRVKGYTLMQGYYKKPQATAESFTEDGWFKTGDTAKIREDGRLIFLGRYKDMLKVGGENVSPAEVEAHLMKIPGIQATSVVAYPDQRLHEVGVAFTILKTDIMLAPDEIIGFLKGKIASFKIPRHIIFVQEFPMTSSGKVQKAKLRKQAVDILG